MEFLFTTAVVCFFFAGIFALEGYRAKKAEKEYIERIRSDYLTLSQKQYSADRFAKLNRYLLGHQKDEQIDDITWNDCGMDDLFMRMNYTLSAIGEEYLYYQLHTLNQDETELEHLEKLIQAIGEDAETRTKMQFLFHQLGYMGKYSIYDYIDNLDFLGERSNRKHFMSLLLYPVAVGLMFIQFPMGVAGVIGVMLYHMMTYFKEKGEIEPYIISFAYVQKMTACSEAVAKTCPDTFEQETSLLKKIVAVMRPMNFASFLVMDTEANHRASGDILGVIIDYFKMIFHLDLIKFNSMYHFVEAHTDEIDQMITTLGYVECVINTWIFRQSLKEGWCIPEFSKDKKLQMEAIYHPMLEKPVKNSINTQQHILLTGSNASGKSTFLKTVAMNAVLAQTVHTCAADQVEMPFMLVYSSMTLKDDIQGGDSYYIVEIKALKRILDIAAASQGYVLCFVDEVLRGTNTVERIAASSQILEGLPENTICFAATHDIELTDLLNPAYTNYHFEEDICDGDIHFNYRLLEGKATTRNAIKLLELLGYEEKLIEKATDRAERFVKTGVWE